MKEKEMDFFDHLEELRKRILYSFIYIFIFSSLIFPYSNKVIDYISRPVNKLYFFSPQEAIFIRIKLSFAIGIVLSIPFVLHQIYIFVSPALTEREKKIAIFFVISTFFLFYISLFLSFFIFIPFIVITLIKFSGNMSPLINVSNYFSFIIWISGGLALAFQFPILTGTLKKMGIIDAKWLIENWRFVVVFIFIFSAIITPTYDIVTMLIIAIPLFLLYILSIFSTLIIR